MNKKENDSFVMYTDQWEHLSMLTPEQLGYYLTDIFEFAMTGIQPEREDKLVKFAVSYTVAQIRRDKQKYRDRCEKNAQNIQRRWGQNEGKRAENANDRIPTDTFVYDRIRTNTKHTDTDTDTDTGTDTDTERERNARAHEARGTYGNVFLTDAEYGELRQELPGIDGLIERLSVYMQATGKGYDDHAAALRLWGERARDIHAQTERNGERDGGGFDTDEFFAAAVERGSKYGSIEETANAPPAGQNML